MDLNQKETGQRFAGLNQKRGMADIIESKSLLNQVRIADDARLPMAQEKILFSTFSQGPEFLSPEMKLLSMLGHFESKLQERKDAMKEKTQLQRTMEPKSNLNNIR